MRFDVVVAGAGPVGLAFAGSLRGCGLRVAVVDPQPEAALAAPGFDGREIALSHRSVAILRALGAWAHIPADAVSPLRQARVLNGPSDYFLHFDAAADGTLGCFAPNHLIRQALWQAAAPHLQLLPGRTVAAVDTDRDAARVRLDDGQVLDTALVVAADTRLSATRQARGIGASVQDFRKRMLVCRVAHERAHGGVATAWFDYGRTLSLLPLNGNTASAVLTLPPADAARLEALDDAAFGAAATRLFRNRLGRMRVASPRRSFPVVTSYARQFVRDRFALIGDAAVGMHPVTAHGFNLGLLGQDTLAREMRAALRVGRTAADPGALRRYEAAHRRATLPLFAATTAIVRLYETDTLPTRLLRDAALRLGNLAPVRTALSARLNAAG